MFFLNKIYVYLCLLAIGEPAVHVYVRHGIRLDSLPHSGRSLATSGGRVVVLWAVGAVGRGSPVGVGEDVETPVPWLKTRAALGVVAVPRTACRGQHEVVGVDGRLGGLAAGVAGDHDAHDEEEQEHPGHAHQRSQQGREPEEGALRV